VVGSMFWGLVMLWLRSSRFYLSCTSILKNMHALFISPSSLSILIGQNK
jgi:hypothetical protein